MCVFGEVGGCLFLYKYHDVSAEKRASGCDRSHQPKTRRVTDRRDC